MRMICTLFLSLLGMPVVCATNGSANLAIVENGQSEYKIVCSRDAVPATLLAATELQQLVQRSTGVLLPIVAPAKHGPVSILLRSDATVPRDSFTLKVEGSNLVISGHDTDGDPRFVDYEKGPTSCGTLYGVYELLETQLGVRFYWPDELGTIIPSRTSFTVPRDLSVIQRPRFTLRRLWHGPEYVNYRDEAASRMWGRRLRLGASTPLKFNHAWFRILNVKEWAAKGHPEYAALVDGVRRTEYDRRERRNGQVCTSNPKVQSIFVEAARVSKNAMFSVSPNDGYGGHCECDNCRSLDSGRSIPDGRFTGKRDLSDRIISFYNLIAQRADRPVGGNAYNEYIEVPANTKLHPGVAISVAMNNAWLSGIDEERARAERLYRAWGEYSPRTTAFDIFYLNKQMHDLIAPLGESVDRRVRLIAESGMAGALFYIAPEMELAGPDAYVAAKLMWDPTADATRLREDYFRDLYGRSWQSVQRIYLRTAAQWHKVVPEYKWSKKRRQALLQIIPEMRADLKQAEDQAGGADPLVTQRLARLRQAIDRMATAPD